MRCKIQTSSPRYAVVSFFVTNPIALRQMGERWVKRGGVQGVVTNNTLQKTAQIPASEYGGSIALIDLNDLKKGIIVEVPLNLAFGMVSLSNNFYVVAGNGVYTIRNRKVHEIYSNNLFSDLHGLSSTSSGNLLVVSTATDSLIEFNPETQQVVWRWFATQQGYNTTPAGIERIIDDSVDYRPMSISTPEHTTHINTAIEYDVDTVLATLFHQGELISIDKRTGKASTVLAGLKSPHGVRKCLNGYTVCDTRANRVLLLDDKFKISSIISDDYNWVQDALVVPTQNEKYVICDSNNGRIIVVDDNRNLLDQFDFGLNNRKIASIELISENMVNMVFGQNLL